MDEIITSYEIKYQQLLKEDELTKKSIDEYKKKIQTFNNLEKIHQDESNQIKYYISTLTTTNKLQRSEHEGEIIKLKKLVAERRNDLELQISELKIQNDKLKNEIESHENIESIDYTESPRHNIESFQSTILELKETINHLGFEKMVKQQQCDDLEQDLRDFRDKKEELLSNLDIKTGEIKQLKQAIHHLTENNNCLKQKIDSALNKPNNQQTQTNSLFAEVNDGRMQLKEKIEVLATKYDKTAKIIASLHQEIELVRLNNIKLKQLMEADSKKFCTGNTKEMSAYSSTLSGLKALLTHYKQEIRKVKKEELDNDVRVIDRMYYEKQFTHIRDAIKSLMEDVDMHIFDHQMMDREMSLLGTEMRNWKRKALKLEGENQNLQLTLKDLE